MQLNDRTLLLRLATATLLALGAGPVVAQTVPRIEWEACRQDPAYECAFARVPLDYDEPDGARTRIALARVAATDPARRIGTLFLNPGGPGGSGVDLILGGYGDYMMQRLNGRFDIVGFDPRGVARSEPIHCFDGLSAFYAWWIFPYFPYERGQEPSFFRDLGSLSGLCHARGERIIDHMSTADVVRDLDLLRQAVGDTGLNFVGWSYGSYIGNTYANLFPANVRALVIDGVLDPGLWASGDHIVLDRFSVAEEFEEFLRLCDEAECPLSGPEGASARWWALAAAVREEPVDLGYAYSYDYLIADAVGAMYEPEYWPDYGEFFASLIDTVEGRTGAASEARTRREALVERMRPGRASYSNDYEAYYGNQCADTQYPRSLAQFREVGTFAEVGSVFGAYWWWQNAACADWPVAADRYAGPWETTTSSPVLVVGNYFDGITDYAGAYASSRLLLNSRLLVYAGWGHTAYGRSLCVTRYVDQYLLRRALPPRGTVCPANPNPFLPAAAARRRAEKLLPAISRPPTGWPGWRR